ncbi:hypothetical protein MTR67_051481 [Solanum verrucosum]|uniref:Uncharacterized protein n=1 Tax=Solanum verrucosum TaxID=315347 RepID=A0AAF1A065_SOLVR|nr:hypothetical protein MTR67_051481 [Solanum verrucosum]
MLEVSSSKPLASESKGFAFWVELVVPGLPSAGCWPITNFHVQKMQVAKIKMLRWMCRHTRSSRIRNEDFHESGNDLCGGQDEGRETEMVWVCEKEMCKCPNKQVQVVGYCGCEGTFLALLPSSKSLQPFERANKMSRIASLECTTIIT